MAKPTDNVKRGTKQLAEYCKANISESVIRKALYWASESIDWQLESSSDHWRISWTGYASDKAQLDRLINDFLLREQLDQRTGDLRRHAIEAALRRLTEGG